MPYGYEDEKLVALGGIEPTVFRVKGERPKIH